MNVVVMQVGRQYVVDLTAEEELCADFSLHVAVSRTPLSQK